MGALAPFPLTPEDRVDEALLTRGPSLMVAVDRTVGNRMLSGIIQTCGLGPKPILACFQDIFLHGPAFTYHLLSGDSQTSLSLGAIGPAASVTAPVVGLKAKLNLQSATHLPRCKPNI